MSGDYGIARSVRSRSRQDRRAWRGTAVVALALIAMVIGPAGTAAAQDVIYRPSACFNGDAGPRDTVSVANGPSFFTNVILYCGDPTKGVIHIDAEHPIAEDGSDDENVQDCHKNVMFRGEEVRANAGNRAWQVARPSGGTATVVFDADTLETITMFTSDSNNWAACARFPD